MKPFYRLLLGAIGGGVLALGRPSVTLANGGDLHLGGVATGIPIFAVWIGGGVMGAFILFFLYGWGLSRQAKKRSQEEEKERSPEATKEAKS